MVVLNGSKHVVCLDFPLPSEHRSPFRVLETLPGDPNCLIFFHQKLHPRRCPRPEEGEAPAAEAAEAAEAADTAEAAETAPDEDMGLVLASSKWENAAASFY